MSTSPPLEQPYPRVLSGAPVDDLPSALIPSRAPIRGNSVELVPQDARRHAADLYAAGHDSEQGLKIWDYLAYGPWASVDDYTTTMRAQSANFETIFYAIRALDSDHFQGQSSFLDINPQMGVIEIGHIWFGPGLARTRAATEALYLMIRHAMDDLGYRRMHWRCNSLNEKSRQAARRLGFRFEGVFYNHMIFKGKNRDTAWYSILDDEWPEVHDILESWLDDANFDDNGQARTSLSEKMSQRIARPRGQTRGQTRGQAARPSSQETPMTSENTTDKPSVCPLDCPDTCSLQITVSDGIISKVRGSRVNPYTAGAICDKVTKYYPEFVHGALRLRSPLRRTGAAGSDEFEEISWDKALSLIAERTQQAIEEHGPQSVLPFNYAGPHGQLAGGSMDRRFFHKLGASLLDRGPLCGGVRGAAYTSLFGNAPGMPPEQAADADLIAVWGNNVTVSNLHLARVIKQAREQGAKLIVVDPKRTRIAEQAHLYLQIEPGTDVVLALAIAAEIERRDCINREFIDKWVAGYDEFMLEARVYSLEQAAQICKVPLAGVIELVDWYCAANKLALSIGNGIERGKSGGSGLRAIMSISALLGQFGRRGAGVIAKSGFAFPTTPQALQRADLIPEGTRTLNIVDIGRHLLQDDIDPPIRAAFIYNHNPVATHPDQNRMMRALSREDIFKVGIDVVMTDSMRYCDVVLPAASHFEFDDVYAAYGHAYLQRAEPVIPPVGESLPNTEIFRRLAQAFGFNDAMFDDSDEVLMDAALATDDPRLQGYRPSQIPLDRALLMTTAEQQELIMCDTVKPDTDSGRIELFCQDLEDRFGYGVPRYQAVTRSKPFSIITPSSSKRTNATFGGDSASAGPEIVEINPADALAAGIDEDDLVEIANQRGRVILQARLTDAVATGVLYSPKGTWLASSASGQTVNALIDAELKTDIVDGACYNETFVDIRRLAQ